MPARIAHRAIAELTAGHPRVEEAAAVARTLVDRDEFDRRQLPDLPQRQLELAIDLALDCKHKLIRIEIVGNVGEVVADEKGVVRRDRAFIENRERRLKLRRAAGQADHRPLLRISHERALAVIEWQRHGFDCECRR